MSVGNASDLAVLQGLPTTDAHGIAHGDFNRQSNSQGNRLEGSKAGVCHLSCSTDRAELAALPEQAWV